MRLAAQQAALQAAIRDGADPGALLQPGPGLAAYRHAYWARLRDALADNFPAVAQALGDDGFAALADAYASAQPPGEPSIRWHGHAFAEFLAHEAPHPALADLARLDWALRQAFDGGEQPPLSREWLGGQSPAAWATRRARLQPHASLLQLDWAVAPLWHALNAARDAGQEADLPAPEPLAHALLVGRGDDGQTQWRSLADDEAEALALLLGAASLADWLQTQGEAALPQAVAWLQRWAGDRLLAVD